MSRKKSVLICTCNADMCSLLEMRFLESGFFSVIDATKDGERALTQMKQFYPDLFVIDYQLKRPDIYSMVSRIREISEYCRSQIFLLVPYTRSLTAKELLEFSCEKHFTYPCDYDTIVESAISIFSKSNKDKQFREDFNKKATVLLEKEDIPRHLSGYSYIMEAAFIIVSSPDECHGAYELYIDVAKKFNTKPENVERNIRTALNQSRKMMKRPTNLAFIYYLASKIIHDL